MENQAKENKRIDLELRAMEIHSWKMTKEFEPAFHIFRVYNGWIYINIKTKFQTFVPESLNVNADCRQGN